MMLSIVFSCIVLEALSLSLYPQSYVVKSFQARLLSAADIRQSAFNRINQHKKSSILQEIKLSRQSHTTHALHLRNSNKYYGIRLKFQKDKRSFFIYEKTDNNESPDLDVFMNM